MFKGIHRTTRKRADGSVARYVYAWRGGPRLEAEPGTREFAIQYNAAVNGRRAELSRVHRRDLRFRGNVAAQFEKFFAGKLLSNAAARAAKYGFACDLSKERIIGLFNSQQARCAVTDIEFDIFYERLGGYVTNPFAPSLDRVSCRDGYTITNTRLVLFAVNTAINEWGLETYLDIAAAALNHNRSHRMAG